MDNQLQFSGTKTIVGRLVVVHHDGARIACAKILPVRDERDIENCPDGSTTNNKATKETEKDVV